MDNCGLNESIIRALTTLTNIIGRDNEKWTVDINTGEFNFHIPEKLCLVHSEISEALEGHRKNLKDDKLPQYDMFGVELADAIIRILHICYVENIPIGEVLIEKLKYNRVRDDHKLENRKKGGGKKY